MFRKTTDKIICPPQKYFSLLCTFYYCLMRTNQRGRNMSLRYRWSTTFFSCVFLNKKIESISQMSGRKHVTASSFIKCYTLARARARGQAALCAPIPACRRTYEINLAQSKIFCKRERRMEPYQNQPLCGDLVLTMFKIQSLLPPLTCSGVHSGCQGSILGVKRPKLEVNHSPPFIAEVKNGWRFTSTTATHGVHKENLTFNYPLIQTLVCQVRLLIINLSTNMNVIGLIRWICELFSRFNSCFFAFFSLLLHLFIYLFHSLFLSVTLKLLLHSVFLSLSQFCVWITYANF